MPHGSSNLGLWRPWRKHHAPGAASIANWKRTTGQTILQGDLLMCSRGRKVVGGNAECRRKGSGRASSWGDAPRGEIVLENPCQVADGTFMALVMEFPERI